MKRGWSYQQWTVRPIPLLLKSDRPAGDRHRRNENDGRDRAAVHEVDSILARAAVAPQDVGLAVAVEVADAGDSPVEVRYRRDEQPTYESFAIHETERVLAGKSDAPDELRETS